MVQVENTMTNVSTTAPVNGKSWTDLDLLNHTALIQKGYITDRGIQLGLGDFHFS